MKKHTIRPSLDLKSASAPQPAPRISMWPFQSPCVFNVARPGSRSEKLLEYLRGDFNDGGGGRGHPRPARELFRGPRRRWRRCGESLGFCSQAAPPPPHSEHQNFIIASLSVAAPAVVALKGSPRPSPARPRPLHRGPASSKQLNGKQPLTRGPGRRCI